MERLLKILWRLFDILWRFFWGPGQGTKERVRYDYVTNCTDETIVITTEYFPAAVCLTTWSKLRCLEYRPGQKNLKLVVGLNENTSGKRYMELVNQFHGDVQVFDLQWGTSVWVKTIDGRRVLFSDEESLNEIKPTGTTTWHFDPDIQ